MAPFPLDLPVARDNKRIMATATLTIDLDALTANWRALDAQTACDTGAVVKANGYGHGSLTMARALEAHSDALAVACIEEAVELRDGGITAPILLLEGVFEADELLIAAQLGFWIMIDNEQQMVIEMCQ